MRLTENIPAWVGSYVGLEFKDRGRDRDGVDCWGLCRLVYAERLGIMLPALDQYSSTADRDAIACAVNGERPDWTPIELSKARVGDVPLFKIVGQPWHVGVLVGRDRMLHAQAGTRSCITRLGDSGWAPRLEAVYRYAGPVRIVAAAVPFGRSRIDRHCPAGMTIAEMLGEACVSAPGQLRVFVGDREVPPAAWCHVRPKPGRVVTVTAVPAGGGGGGKDTLRIVLQIAVVIGAAALTGGLAAAGYSTVIAAVAGAGVSIGASLAINALIPPSKPRLTEGGSDLKPSPTITGSRNELRPHAPIPVPLGLHRMVPPYGSAPYTEVIGDDQYLRLLFCLGYGPLEVTDLKIGETPIDQFEGVEYQIRQGVEGEDPMTLYPGTVIEEGLSILLEYNVYEQRTSSNSADELSIEIVFPQGLVTLGPQGGRFDRTVEVEVEYSPAGENNWQRINATSPDTAREMDILFRTPEVEQGTLNELVSFLAWGGAPGFGDPRPSYLPAAPATNFSWEASGLFFADVAGTWTFGLDSANASDLWVDGRPVASWYGQHGTMGATPDFTGHNGTIELEPGWHAFRVRVECRTTAPVPAFAAGVMRPGGAWEVLQAESAGQPRLGHMLDDGSIQLGLQVRWFNTGNFGRLITTAARPEPIRRTLAWAVDRGQYDVRLRRITTADVPGVPPERVVDDVYWVALRTIRAEDPIKESQVARIALRIKASDQLSGIVDQFNCMVQSMIPDWDSGTQSWVIRPTRNVASLYRHVLQGSAIARPVADGRIDLEELQAWHELAASSHQWFFSAIYDTPGTVAERLADICAAGRASFAMRDGRFSIVRDRFQTVPIQHFTPRNSSGFTGRKAFPDLPHALRIGFINEEKNYSRDERIVLDDFYTLDGLDAFGTPSPLNPPATRFETLEFFGVTNPDTVFRLGRYHLAVAKLRPEVYELGTDVEHIACTRGDLVLVTHDVPLWGSASARVLALILDTADRLLGLQLDETVTMELGENYRVRVRLSDGTSWLRDVVTTPGDTNQLRFSAPVDAAEPRPAKRDLVMFGKLGLETRELIVKAIDIDRDLSAKLTLVDASPDVFQADVGNVPPFDPGLTLPPSWMRVPPAPIIDQARSDDLVMRRDSAGVLTPRVLLSVRIPSGASSLIPDKVQARFRPRAASGAVAGAWEQLPPVPGSQRDLSIDGVEAGTDYDISVRTLAADGTPSTWTTTTHLVEGQTRPPPAPASFSVERRGSGVRRYSWTLGDVPPDVVGIRVRFGETWQSWDQMADVSSAPLTTSPTDLDDPPAGPWRFRARTVDAAGNVSTGELVADVDLSPAALEDVAFDADERFDGWDGTKTDCVVEVDGTLAADDNGVGGWLSPMVYTSPALDAGAVFEFTPGAYAEADGYLTLELAWSSDDVVYSDWALASAVAGKAVVARYLKARVTVAGNGSYPRPVLHELQVLMRAQAREIRLVGLVTSTLPAAYILGAGDVRLPIPRGRMALVRSVQVEFIGSGNRGFMEIIDRNASPGPRVLLYEKTGSPAHGTIDAVIKGYAGPIDAPGVGGKADGGENPPHGSTGAGTFAS